MSKSYLKDRIKDSMNICLNILFLIKLNYGGDYFIHKFSQLERVEFHILLPKQRCSVRAKLDI